MRTQPQLCGVDLHDSWPQVWKLYNTSSMDFHLFFCCANVERLHGGLDAAESALFKPLWQVSASKRSLILSTNGHEEGCDSRTASPDAVHSSTSR